jgi:hypothetical protein
MKPTVIHHIEQENFERLKRRFSVTELIPARMREITGGQSWRIPSTREWSAREKSWTGFNAHLLVCRSMLVDRASPS